MTTHKNDEILRRDGDRVRELEDALGKMRDGYVAAQADVEKLRESENDLLGKVRELGNAVIKERAEVERLNSLNRAENITREAANGALNI